MQKLHHQVRLSVLGIIDFFYPMFKPLLPLQAFRYAACGGGNTLLSILVYFVSYNFILQKQMVHLGPVTISPHIAALIIGSGLTVPIGFYLSMYVVFQGSYLRRHIQLFRYFMVVTACFCMNYLLLKIFVEVFGWYPTPSQILTIIIVVGFSYLSQRYFSFKVAKPGNGQQPQCSQV